MRRESAQPFGFVTYMQLISGKITAPSISFSIRVHKAKPQCYVIIAVNLGIKEESNVS